MGTSETLQASTSRYDATGTKVAPRGAGHQSARLGGKMSGWGFDYGLGG